MTYQLKVTHQFRGEGEICDLCFGHFSRHPRPSLKADGGTSGAQSRSRGAKKPLEIFGVDGEGIGRFPHRYVYLCAANEDRSKVYELEDREGLDTKRCLEWFLALPVRHVFGYSLTYDWTKILKDLPTKKIFQLTHEETRLRKGPGGFKQPWPIDWAGYSINYINRKVTLQRCRWDPEANEGKGRTVRYGRKITIWDVFRFFAVKFTDALKDWDVSDRETLAFVEAMKDDRDKLGGKDWETVKRYCQTECGGLAELVTKLISAHKDIGLKLKSYFGVGSTATTLLNTIGILKSAKEPPRAMKGAVAKAFFGGRFEISRVGPIGGPVWNYDISSAYPYQISSLPCLTHGSWYKVGGREVERAIERGRLALVHVDVRPSRVSPSWGPLPWRASDGTITFPLSSGGVWVWKPEYEAARRAFPALRAREAWVYLTACSCQPFSEVPRYYRERLKLGKDAKGLALKLGLNAIYGKLAQSKGSAKFQSWIWAGNITSGTRAQLLDAFMMVEDRTSILMLATDGIFSKEKIKFPPPRDTGTDIEIDGKRKPLGGWEEKMLPNGIFLVRPGIYFPLNPTAQQLKEVKSRGISKKMLLKYSDRIVESWNHHGPYREVSIPGERFVGMKSGLSVGKEEGLATNEARRSDTFGEWVPWPILVSFNPQPKRACVIDDQQLLTWGRKDGESRAYNPAIISPEGQALKRYEGLLLEQQDPEMGLEGGPE